MPHPTGTIHIDLYPSRGLAAAIVFTHAGAMGILVYLANGAPWSVVIAVSIGWSSIVAIRRHAWMDAHDAVVGITCSAGQWKVVTRDGRSRTAEFLATARITSPVAVLSFRFAGGERRAVVVPSDGCDAESYRRLRVRLRCGPVGEANERA